MQVETDIVLSAIRRGEDSLPRLRTATGLEYAQLHTLLYKLEFEWKSIHRQETAEGFSRYLPMESEKLEPVKCDPIGTQQAIPPAAFRPSAMGMATREMSLLQRDAPYCIQCRGLCWLNGRNEETRIQWCCRSCNEVFDGSTLMGRIDPREEARQKVAQMVERGKRPRAEEVDRELSPQIKEEEEEPAMRETNGKPKTRFGISINAEIKRIVEAMPVGTETDTPRLLTALLNAHPPLAQHPEQRTLRTYISQAVHPLRGKTLELVREGQGGQPDLLRRVAKVEKNITQPITARTKPETDSAQPERAQVVAQDTSEDTKLSIAENLDSGEGPNQAMAKTRDIIPEKFQSTARVQVAGGVMLHENFEVRLSEIREWPAERVSEFFDALAKIVEVLPRSMPTTIRPAWSPDLEGQAGDPEATVGLTYCYLIGMLHHNMEPHEKEAVWTLVNYLKRLEAYVEQKKRK